MPRGIFASVGFFIRFKNKDKYNTIVNTMKYVLTSYQKQVSKYSKLSLLYFL